MANTKKLLAAGMLGAAGAAALGLPYHIDVTKYQIVTDKVSAPVRAAVLSDLHNASYGEGMEKLLTILRAQHPDFALMPGDMAEENHHQDNTMILMKKLTWLPSFYTTGNHEEYRPDLAQLKEQIRSTGVQVLDHKSTVVDIRGEQFEIAGIPCRLKKTEFTAGEVSSLFHTDHYRILLSHRPEWADFYRNVHCDLVVCGHAHGGQWNVPGTRIGVAAPGQGFFPKYICGIHRLGNVKMLVSRGLVKHYHGIPRLYNNPELVIIDFVPGKENGDGQTASI